MALRTKIYPRVKQTLVSASSAVTLLDLTKRTYIKKIYIYTKGSGSSVFRIESIINGETIDSTSTILNSLPMTLASDTANPKVGLYSANFGIFPLIYSDYESATYIFSLTDVIVDSLRINVYGGVTIDVSIETLEEV